MVGDNGIRFWTCKSCGTAEDISVSTTHCPGCGVKITPMSDPKVKPSIAARELAEAAYDAGYKAAKEDAAKIAHCMAFEYSAASKETGDYQHAKAVAANSVAAAICKLDEKKGMTNAKTKS